VSKAANERGGVEVLNDRDAKFAHVKLAHVDNDIIAKGI
jgi:hypothetical protein